MRKSAWIVAGLLGLGVAVVCAYHVYDVLAGVRVRARNIGTEPLRSVVFHVTGRSYAVGDLAPGESARVRVEPLGESHVVIEFVDSKGMPKRLTVDCYFEPGYGYHGTISVDLDQDRIHKVRDGTH